MPAERLSEVDAERVARVVSEHPHAGALGRLTFKVLSRQAEGGSLFSGKKYMRRQARSCGVSRGHAETPMGNVLQVLERGPDGALEFALIGGFAVAGFETALAERLGSEIEPQPVLPAADDDGDSLLPPSGPYAASDEGVSDGVSAASDEAVSDGLSLPPEEGFIPGLDAAEALARKFVAHVDWLTLATPFALQPLIPRLLTGTAIRHLAAALRAAVVAEAGSAGAGDASARARVAARIALLSRLPASARCTDVLLAALDDPFTRSLVDISLSPGSPSDRRASDRTSDEGAEEAGAPGLDPDRGAAEIRVRHGDATSAGDADSSEHTTGAQDRGQDRAEDGAQANRQTDDQPDPDAPAHGTASGGQADAERVDAVYGRAPSGPVAGALRWLSGWALLSWLFTGAMTLLGVRRHGSFSLEPAGVRVLAETRAAGRVWSELDEVIRLSDLRFGRRHVRYPGLRRLLGLLGFCLGAIVGALMLFDGLAVMERGLVLAGACVVGAGAALDLVMDVALAGHRGHVALEVAGRDRRYCLRNVPLGEADAFMDALASRHAAAGPSQVDAVGG